MRQGAAWLAAALLVTVAGAAAAQGAGAAPAPFVREETLSACVDPGFAPMEFFRNPGDAQPVGFDVDVVEALAAKLGARARILATDFKGLLPALAAGRCGIVISGMLVTPERKERYDAVPYLATHTVLMAPHGTAIKAPEDLSGKVLAVEAGTVYERLAAELNQKLQATGRTQVTVQTYPTPQAITEQILVGRAAAAMTQDVEAAYRAEQTGRRVDIAYTYPQADQFGIYLRREPGGAEALRAALTALRGDGTMGRIVQAWKLDPANLDVDHVQQAR
jgi:polar amino acid transport system substrate-binding protein